MISLKKCTVCGSEDMNVLFVNTRLTLNYPEEKNPYGCTIQKMIEPTDALVCKKCGHIELFVDWQKE